MIPDGISMSVPKFNTDNIFSLKVVLPQVHVNNIIYYDEIELLRYTNRGSSSTTTTIVLCSNKYIISIKYTVCNKLTLLSFISCIKQIF